MYLVHDEIKQLMFDGSIKDSDPELINTASLDVRLGDTLLVEDFDIFTYPETIDYGARQQFFSKRVRIPDEGFVLKPGQFVLGHTVESFEIPDDICATYHSKSSAGRSGLEHLNAGWIDAGFHGVITLEFKNMLQHHNILLRKGDRVGQLVFLRGKRVQAAQSYKAVGNYNGYSTVQAAGFK